MTTRILDDARGITADEHYCRDCGGTFGGSVTTECRCDVPPPWPDHEEGDAA